MELSGKVEISKNEVYQKFKDIDKSTIDRYMIWISCQSIMNDPSLGSAEKLRLWIEIYRELNNSTKSQKTSRLSLSSVYLGVTRDSIEEHVGKPVTLNPIEVEAGFDETTQKFLWKTLDELVYECCGMSVRVIYDERNLAESIFIGLLTSEEQVALSDIGNWPINSRNELNTVWTDLKFGDQTSDACEGEVHTTLSVALTTIMCPFQYQPSGTSLFNRQWCTFYLGYSDGALGVWLTSSPAEITEFDLAPLIDSGKSEQEISQYIIHSVRASVPNFVGITCNDDLVKRGW